MQKHAKLILTDSGGIQEEAPSFACPTLVMRYETERKEGIEAGVSKLVGADYDKILKESEKFSHLLKQKQDSKHKIHTVTERPQNKLKELSVNVY